MGKFDNKLTDRQKRENRRRVELGMLGLLIEEYPNEAREKLRKLGAKPGKRSENPLVLRE